MDIEKYNRDSPFFQNSVNSENNQGGLNFIEVSEVILRKKLLITGFMIAFASLAFLKAWLGGPSYSGSFEILSKAVTIETKITSTDSDSKVAREEISAVELNEIQLKILKSPKLILRVIKSLQTKYPLLNYDTLIGNLTLEANKNQNEDQKQKVLQVDYENSNRQQVLDVLNRLSQVYLDYSLEQRKIGVNRGLAFLEEQIPQITERVSELENRIRQLRQQHNFVDPELEGNQIAARLDKAVQKDREIEAELKKAKLIASNLKRELSQQPTTSTTAITSGTTGYQELLAQLRKIDGEISKQSAVFTDKSIQIQTLQRQREQIVALINKEGNTNQQKAGNQIELLEYQKRNLETNIADSKEQIEQWSTISSQFSDLQRKLTIETDQLNTFIIQRDALRVDAAQKEAPWELLTPVEEPQTNTAYVANYMLLGTVLGLFCGIGAALALEQYNSVIYTSVKIQEITDLPIVGMIPFDSTKKKLPFVKPINTFQIQLYKDQDFLPQLASPSVEAFRFFGSNLGLFDADNDIKSLIITSAIPGEGKSTVAFNLAKEAAAIGKKVLLVDTDMRSSTRLTTYLGLSDTRGLGDFFAEIDPDFHSFIQPLPLEENLFILASGSVEFSNNSSLLLASEKMRNLMDNLQANFELIVYDMSSIVEFADVSLLGAKTDGIVMVTGLGKVQNKTLEEALNLLKLSKIPVLGIAVNQTFA